MTAIKTKCPRCKQLIQYDHANPFRPFCSERCKLIDLGQWASESYKIPAAPVNDTEIDPGTEISSQSKDNDETR